jgi:hypothetical protein
MGGYKSFRNLGRSDEVTLVWVKGHHAIPENEADKLAKEGTNGVHFDQFVGISSVVGTVVIRNYLKQEPLNRRQSCKGCRQSKTPMTEPLSCRRKRSFKQ